MTDIFLYDYPRTQLRLEYMAPNEVHAQLELARLALEDVFLFADGFFEPLSLDLWLACCDVESGYPLGKPVPPNPFWLLQQKELPPRVRVQPAWESETVASVVKLNPGSILNWMKRAFEQDCPQGTGTTLGWREMLFRAISVRLPNFGNALNGDSLHVRYGLGTIEHPVERRGDTLWVSGPIEHKTLTAPMDVRLSNEAGLFILDISLYWSIWTSESDEKDKQIASAIDKLLNRRWQQA